MRTCRVLRVLISCAVYTVQVAQAGKAISEGLSSSVDAMAAAARATKELAEREETKATLEAVRDATVVTFKAAKEVWRLF